MSTTSNYINIMYDWILKSVNNTKKACVILKQGRTRVGRHQPVEVKLKSIHTSRCHSTIIVRPNGLTIIDHSKNGILINDERFEYKTTLYHGDIIHFSDIDIYELRKVKKIEIIEIE